MKTDKEIIEELDFQDNYEASYRFIELKKDLANARRRITSLERKKWALIVRR